MVSIENLFSDDVTYKRMLVLIMMYLLIQIAVRTAQDHPHEGSSSDRLV